MTAEVATGCRGISGLESAKTGKVPSEMSLLIDKLCLLGVSHSFFLRYVQLNMLLAIQLTK